MTADMASSCACAANLAKLGWNLAPGAGPGESVIRPGRLPNDSLRAGFAPSHEHVRAENGGTCTDSGVTGVSDRGQPASCGMSFRQRPRPRVHARHFVPAEVEIDVTADVEGEAADCQPDIPRRRRPPVSSGGLRPAAAARRPPMRGAPRDSWRRRRPPRAAAGEPGLCAPTVDVRRRPGPATGVAVGMLYPGTAKPATV